MAGHAASHRRGRRLALAVVLGAVLATGCAPQLQLRTAEVPEASQAVLVGDFLGKTEVDFRDELVLSAQQGRLMTVSVTDATGAEVPGELANGGTEWHIPAGILELSTQYTVKATVVDRYGTALTQDAAFTTIVPSNVLDYDVSVADGATYGVGMPITITFNKMIADRAAVEQRLQVTTSTPVEGSWSWRGDRTVSYRPKEYWPAGVKVSMTADLRGVEPEPGLFGVENTTVNFQTGNAVIATVDAATHMMTVRRNGVVERTVPITTGKPGWETRSGIKVIMSKQRHVIMDASTLGVDKEDPEYYRLDVDYALRITSSGEFVHAAPWSVASQGVANVSHGCVGLSTANASWFYNSANVGDIVQVINTGRAQDRGNGITVWNESWDSWKAGSALAPAPPA